MTPPTLAPLQDVDNDRVTASLIRVPVAAGHANLHFNCNILEVIMRKVFVAVVAIVLMVLDLRCSFAQPVPVRAIKPGLGNVVLCTKTKGGKRFVAGSFFKFHQHKQNPQQ